MSHAFVCRPGSTLGERVAERVRGECAVLAPAESVRVDDRDVAWNGTRLDGLSALVVESPLVAWPQPSAEPRPGEALEVVQRRGFARRERRALHVSALRVLVGRVRVANDPLRALELASCSPLALERLERASVRVRPWRVVPEPSGDSGWAALLLADDPEVREELSRAPNGPRLEVAAAPGGARAHLCVGGARLASAACDAALEPRLDHAAPDAAHDEGDAELALAALAALGLDYGLVVISEGAVARASAAPDLDAWDRARDGVVAHALASWLTSPRTSPVAT